MQGRLDDAEVERAIPERLPDWNLLNETVYGGNALDSGPNEALRRANAWASVIENELLRQEPRTLGYEPRLTTYGFFRIGSALRFGVVRYCRPLEAFRMAGRHEYVEVDGHSFPIILRPWISSSAAAAAPSPPYQGMEHPCWVSSPNTGERGFLTAAHTIRPVGAALGDYVTTNTALSHPSGTLTRSSAVMDVALVSTSNAVWAGGSACSCSTVVGYKPVRFYVRGRHVDTQVVEHSGFLDAVVPRAGATGEPDTAVRFLFALTLKPGDSGTVGYDREFTQYGGHELPYLMYLGTYGGRRGLLGRGVFLHQAQLSWGIDFHS